MPPLLIVTDCFHQCIVMHDGMESTHLSQTEFLVVHTGKADLEDGGMVSYGLYTQVRKTNWKSVDLFSSIVKFPHYGSIHCMSLNLYL